MLTHKSSVLKHIRLTSTDKSCGFHTISNAWFSACSSAFASILCRGPLCWTLSWWGWGAQWSLSILENYAWSFWSLVSFRGALFTIYYRLCDFISFLNKIINSCWEYLLQDSELKNIIRQLDIIELRKHGGNITITSSRMDLARRAVQTVFKCIFTKGLVENQNF